jgi:hypothetical protein
MAGAALFCIHFLSGQSVTAGSPHSVPASEALFICKGEVEIAVEVGIVVEVGIEGGIGVGAEVAVAAGSIPSADVTPSLSHPAASAHASQGHPQSRIAR